MADTVSYCAGCQFADEMEQSILDDLNFEVHFNRGPVRGGVEFSGYGASAI
jgi:hypothetical protein